MRDARSSCWYRTLALHASLPSYPWNVCELVCNWPSHSTPHDKLYLVVFCRGLAYSIVSLGHSIRLTYHIQVRMQWRAMTGVTTSWPSDVPSGRCSILPAMHPSQQCNQPCETVCWPASVLRCVLPERAHRQGSVCDRQSDARCGSDCNPSPPRASSTEVFRQLI